MTTNHIAERAGVNIASLYQYFPNKQAIVIELLKRHVERARRALVPVMERSRDGTIEQRLRSMIELMAAEHAVDPQLHALFTTLGPQLGFEPASRDSDTAIARQSAAWVKASSLPNPALALWVAQTAIHAVFHTAFIERPDIASQPILVDELVRLVTPYLDPARSSQRKRKR